MAANPKGAITPAGGSALATAGPSPLEAALAAYEPAKYNFATPITVLDQLPPMHRVSVRVVKVDPESETYPIPASDKVGLGKTALDKIAAAAGITWLPERSGQVDTWNDRHHVKYRATAQIRDFDGRVRVVFAEKEIDLRGESSWPEDELGDDAREYVRIAAKRNRDAWPQIMQQRQHIHSLAESKAKLRCIRSAIGLPIAMAKADVAKPFVVPTLVPDLDTSDPEIKRMVAASLIGSQSALYGPQLPVGAQTPALDEETDPIDLAGFEEVTDPAVSGQQELPIEAVTATVDEAPAPEPWDMPPCPLPFSTDALNAIPKSDTRRYEAALRINDLFAALGERIGAGKAAGLVVHHTGGTFAIHAAPWESVVALGKAIKAELAEAGGEA